jgi:ABC-2 type transport system ATP-binding protein
MTDAIRIEGITKIFKRGWRTPPVIAVDNVTLTVAEGEAFGFIGPNGAGKSTTIKILTGIQLANSGQVKIFGAPVADPISRHRLGYVPESPYLFDYLTPIEILLMGLRMHRLRIPNEEAHCLRWLERLELGHVARKTIHSFSKGMTQRVALAQALSVEPRLLILDEPLSGLDPVGRRDVVSMLSEYRKSGGTLFFTSHVLHDVERLADRFGLIHRGRLRAVRSPAELAGEDEAVTIRTLGESPIDGLLQETPGRWTIQVRRSDVWQTLEKLQKANHVLIEVRPTLSLESAFLRAIGHGESGAFESPGSATVEE